MRIMGWEPFIVTVMTVALYAVPGRRQRHHHARAHYFGRGNIKVTMMVGCPFFHEIMLWRLPCRVGKMSFATAGG